jgi:outer membrane lipoprotein-sorting protein
MSTILPVILKLLIIFCLLKRLRYRFNSSKKINAAFLITYIYNLKKNKMKNLIIFGLFILSLVIAQFAQAQTVDEIINKHIAALGGTENLNKIQSVLMEGSLSVQGADVSITTTEVNNKLSRQDFNVMGMHGFDMTTDKDGWKYMPFYGMQQPEPKNAEEVKDGQTALDIAGPLVNYAAKGHKVELQGKEDVNGTQCYKLKVTLAGGKEITFFIDPATNMITRTKNKEKVNGQETDVQTDFADYKDVDGVKMPYSITMGIGTIFISSIKFNQVIPDSSFKHDM